MASPSRRSSPPGPSYRTYATAAFTVSAGTHTISLRGLNSAGGDNTAFFDAVSLTALATSTPGGASATRWTVYDGQTPLLDFNASGTVTARYLSVPGAIDELLARQTASGVAWYLDDREGSVKDLINNAGSVLDHVDYGAYGTVQAESAPAQGDRFKYAGMEYDAAIGANHVQTRWYDPANGRYLSQDTISFEGGDADLYIYVGNGPTDAVDPTGEWITILVGAVIGGVIGGVTTGTWQGVGVGAVGGALIGTGVGLIGTGGIIGGGGLGGGGLAGIVGGAAVAGGTAIALPTVTTGTLTGVGLIGAGGALMCAAQNNGGGRSDPHGREPGQRLLDPGPAHLNLGKSSESLQHIALVECGVDSLPVETSFARVLPQ